MEEKLTRDQSVSVFERMLLIRRFEEMVVRLFKEKHFFCHYHLYIGQEATGAAAIELLEPDDLTLTTHRNHGHVVGRGGDVGKALAEILGRADGFNRGRGGTLHMTDRSVGFLSTSAVVGNIVGLAAGAAYALKQAGKGNIAIAFFGKGLFSSL
jgi:pyruvate dehydrogenase E1 component alpha subunit